MKCDEQMWQQKQIGLEASDLRERLLDSHYGLCLTVVASFIDVTVLLTLLLIFIPIKAREYVFTGIGLCVCVYVCVPACDHDN